jgi:ATP-binding cassette subfamily B (MDR/TAP) protein 1
MMTLCLFTAMGSGAAMPLMFLIFGKLVGNFTGYFTPGSGITKHQFLGQVERNAYVELTIGSWARLTANHA